MAKEQIIQLMAEAGLKTPARGDFIFIHWDQIALLIKHAIAKDREAIALLIEKRGAQGYGTLAIAAEVRADNACSTLCHPEEPCFITEDGMCAKRGSHGQT